eukprot:TRINITY_DN32290_c0_g1_i1.p1 TRINITY_DN32290_c0_g1~~TRINITY_DN32290_c0_g1_i1.p1  ORF type:complete len:116 (-),score=18.93 TRINITY_DN32290_c0_g1_i1:810-1157(-)
MAASNKRYQTRDNHELKPHDVSSNASCTHKSTDTYSHTPYTQPLPHNAIYFKGSSSKNSCEHIAPFHEGQKLLPTHHSLEKRLHQIAFQYQVILCPLEQQMNNEAIKVKRQGVKH